MPIFGAMCGFVWTKKVLRLCMCVFFVLLCVIFTNPPHRPTLESTHSKNFSLFALKFDFQTHVGLKSFILLNSVKAICLLISSCFISNRFERISLFHHEIITKSLVAEQTRCGC